MPKILLVIFASSSLPTTKFAVVLKSVGMYQQLNYDRFYICQFLFFIMCLTRILKRWRTENGFC